MNVTGVVKPRTGEFYALEFSHSDTTIFQVFLEHANRDISFERPRNLLILDNASWHKSKSLDWGRFEPIFFPLHSPDLNPIETVHGLGYKLNQDTEPLINANIRE